MKLFVSLFLFLMVDKTNTFIRELFSKKSKISTQNMILYRRRFESEPFWGSLFKSVTDNLVEESSAVRVELFNCVKPIVFHSIENNGTSENKKPNTFLEKILTRSNHLRKKYNGNDNRYNTTYNDNHEELQKIRDSFEKYKLLQKLQSKNVANNEKIKAIDNYNYHSESSKYISDISKGGLYNDWNNNVF